MANRDEFTQKTKDILAKRVGYHCSNPKCKKHTIGPSSIPEKTINIGVAAHITAASPKGPRYNKSLSSKQRKNIRNAIWLCQNCSVLIDRDEKKYTCQILNKWKDQSEFFASKSIGGVQNFSSHQNHDVKCKEKVVFNKSAKEGYYCEIHINQLPEIIYFKYFPPKNEWDSNQSQLSWENSYYFTFINLEEWLNKELNYSPRDIIIKIEEIRSIIQVKGIDGVAEFMFNYQNPDLPKYSAFVKAFHFYSNLNKVNFTIKPVGSVIHFKTEGLEYVIDTYAGMMKELRVFIKNKSLEEIYTMTNESIWNTIFVDVGIEKERFIPKMLHLWEKYWIDVDRGIYYSNMSKEESWRQFLIFSESYNHTIDIIEFSYEINDFIFYPLAVITMLNILDTETCYEEYCDYYFENEEWQDIQLNDDEPIFFIKLKEE
ncbi:MAG: unknown, without homologous in databases [uncultured Aureispira sp.]|uniref:HNH endonuclease n=1 Tax=uncultured Aureispira sp. TaxID=1331704 RepID=A0A6S6UN07_9BACT|nr:MAG: unknown, without homologous in databases [uncultured Aureispira sp.]